MTMEDWYDDSPILNGGIDNRFPCIHGCIGQCFECNPGTSLSKLLLQLKRGKPIEGEFTEVDPQ